MASKSNAKDEAPEAREEAAEASPLDTVTAAIKKMVAKGKERGYVTYDEINAARGGGGGGGCRPRRCRPSRSKTP